MKPLKNKTLTCYKDGDTTCTTIYSCFAYVTTVKKSPRGMGCVQNSISHLFQCNAVPTANFVAKCCDEDLCNNKLNLTLPNGGSIPKETPSKLFVFQLSNRTSFYRHLFNRETSLNNMQLYFEQVFLRAWNNSLKVTGQGDRLNIHTYIHTYITYIHILFSSLAIGAFQWLITSSVMITFNLN